MHLRWWNRANEISDAPSVILTRAEHLRITQKLQSKLRKGVEHSEQKVWAVYKEVYTDLGYAEWLSYIDEYFR